MLQALGRLCKVAGNPGFSSLLILFSLLSVSTTAFIASSSYIYINGFGLSAQVCSHYFAIKAIGMVLGPMLFICECPGTTNADRLYRLLCGDICQWSAHIIFWRLSALDTDHCALAGNHLCKLCANTGSKFDAGAAKGGYGIRCGSNELGWHLYGKRWHDHNIPELEQ
jgi:hypothetical protein